MATVRKPRKPKMKSMPKKPKASASLDAHKRYEDRAKKVIAENKKKDAEYNRQLKSYEKIQKEKARIRAKY